MNQEDTKQDINIATISLDIKYIKEALAEIKATLRLMDEHYLSQKDADRLVQEGEKTHNRIFDEIEEVRKVAVANDKFINNFKGKYAVAAAIAGLLLPVFISLAVIKFQQTPEERAERELLRLEKEVQEVSEVIR